MTRRVMPTTLTRYQIQGLSEEGQWEWQVVAGKESGATYLTEAQAERALENLIETTGWDRARHRVQQVRYQSTV
jgi:hypothetical protein